MTHTFTIPGPIKGYRASIRRAHDPVYKAWKTQVRCLANLARVPDYQPSKSYPAWVGCEIYWNKNPRIDAMNVIKGVEDGLFPQDRWVMPGKHSVHWDAGVEKVIVVVETEVKINGIL